MPAYRAAGIDVRLSVFELVDLTKMDLFEIEGHELSERRLAFDGDDAEVHFLDTEPVTPFLFVKACGIKKDPATCFWEKRKARHAEQVPRGPSLRSTTRRSLLSMSVDPEAHTSSEQSTLLSAPDLSTKYNSSTHSVLQLSMRFDPSSSFNRSIDVLKSKDLKIDVYLNGSLIQCNYVAARTKGREIDCVIKLSGLRAGRTTEKAWILKKPAQNRHVMQVSLGDEEERSKCQLDKANKARWASISQALVSSADNYGRRYGERPPSGNYLAYLAEAPFPTGKAGPVSSSDGQFAVVDCVLVLGSGTKFSTSHGYLRQPKIMQDYNFMTDEEPLSARLRPARTSASNTGLLSSPISELATRLNSLEGDHVQPTPSLDSGDGNSDVFAPLSRSMTESTGGTFISSEDAFAPPSRSSGTSTPNISLTPREAPNPFDSSTSNSVIQGRNDLRSKTNIQSRFRALGKPAPLELGGPLGQPASKLAGSSKIRTSRLCDAAGKKAHSRYPKVPLLEPNWTIPELSRSCVLTYVDGMSETHGIRHLKSERTGAFIEEEVLVGIRYLLDAETGAE